jgi:hypothetical protein
VAVGAPARPPAQAPDSGLIDDARRRQRRRRTGIAIVLAAMLAAIAYLGGGSGGGRQHNPPAVGGVWPSASVPTGISVSYPAGWHLFPPPDTSLSYPFDRLLITSYPTSTGGGGCSPRRAEAALPARGALIYLFEYGTSSSGVLTRPEDAAFPPEPAAFSLPSRPLNYECWTVPTYMVRFRAAGRLFQAQIALGPRISAARRAQALAVLQSLRVQPLSTSSSPRE